MKLLEDYQKLHDQGKFPGMALLQWVPDIADLIGEFKSKSLLDYGCGEGLQYLRERAHNAWGYGDPTALEWRDKGGGIGMPTLYDPAVKQFSVKPSGQFDGVICTDVAEHVPEDELPAFAAEIAGYARQWALISVCCRPSKYIRLLDGSNVHVTIRPFEWWQEFLAPHFAGVRLELRETK